MLDAIPILPDTEPVAMPELPRTVAITTRTQLRALGDEMRARILDVIAHQPMTAKQLAVRLDGTPGAIGHHLRVLERAGLAQIVAKRLTKGIVAKYYTRTARLFLFDQPHDSAVDVVGHMQRDYEDALREGHIVMSAFPRMRLSHAAVARFGQRVKQLVDEFMAEPVDPLGRVVALGAVYFDAPSYMQTPGEPTLTPMQMGFEKMPHQTAPNGAKKRSAKSRKKM